MTYGMVTCTFIRTVVMARGLGASRYLMEDFQCGLEQALLARLPPAPLSTKHVVPYRADLFTPVPIRTLYEGLTRKETSAVAALL